MEEIEAVRGPAFKVIYEGKDITVDISKGLLDLSYTDNTEAKSDEVTIRMEDVDGLWRNEWYPGKGDKIQVEIGYSDTARLNCGTFEVDETEISGPPDEINIKALAAGITTAMRTRNTRAYQGQTLRQIAEAVASQNGLTVASAGTTQTRKVNVNSERSTLSNAGKTIAKLQNTTSLQQIAVTLHNVAVSLNSKGFTTQATAVQKIATSLAAAAGRVIAQSAFNGMKTSSVSVISRIVPTLINKATTTVTTPSPLDHIVVAHVAQTHEKDLAFLKQLAAQYGYIFSVRDKAITFTSIYDLEGSGAVMELDRSDFATYSIKDKTSTTFARAAVRHYDPKTDKLIEYSYDQNLMPDGQPRTDATAADVLNIRSRADNKQQAEAMAKAALYRANSQQQELEFSMEGTPMICAGNNVEVTGIGAMSGKYHILSSTHTVDRSGGYSVSAKCKRVGYIEKVKHKSTKRRKKSNVTYRVIS